MIDSLSKVYLNVETLWLRSKNNEKTTDQDECLSSIKFKNLTSLSLNDFRLRDGAFLLPVRKDFKNLNEKLY